MLKKLSLGFLVAMFAIFGATSLTKATLVFDPVKPYSGQALAVNCTNDAHYYAVYSRGTKALATGGECDGSENLSIGVYEVLVSATDISAMSYLEALAETVAETATVQVVPIFSDPNTSTELTGNAANGFVTGIGAFFVAQLPTILSFLAALIGLGFLIVRVRRWIGKKA